MIQRQIGIRLLQALVLGFQVFEPLQIGDLQAAVLGAPLVEGGVADSEFAADVLDCHTLFGALQGANDLLFAELALAQDDLRIGTSSCLNSSYVWTQFKGSGQVDSQGFGKRSFVGQAKDLNAV